MFAKVKGFALGMSLAEVDSAAKVHQLEELTDHALRVAAFDAFAVAGVGAFGMRDIPAGLDIKAFGNARAKLAVRFESGTLCELHFNDELTNRLFRAERLSLADFTQNFANGYGISDFTPYVDGPNRHPTLRGYEVKSGYKHADPKTRIEIVIEDRQLTTLEGTQLGASTRSIRMTWKTPKSQGAFGD
jgi:hypothetical protein